MKTKFAKLGLALAFSLGLGTAQADVVVGEDTTTDSDQGLVFLHVGQTSAMSSAEAQAGISFNQLDWRLATVSEFLTLVENASGEAIPEWNGSNLGDFDLTSNGAQLMMDALDGGTVSLPGFWVDGETFGISQVYAHTSSFNDFHVQSGPQWGSSVPGLFVRQGDAPPPPVTYTVGGTVSGLVGSVTLTNNGGDALVVNTNGSFEFSTALDDAAAYLVAVSVQPVGQTCTVSNGDGAIASADVTDVVVSCQDNLPPPEPTAVPVDSNWALLVLTLSLLLLGGVALRRDW